MSEKNICPGCGRHCDLNDPHCGRGEEYLRTGKIPERQKEKRHCHEMRMAHYSSQDINDKLIINLRDLSHIMHSQYEGKASQKRILIILNESEKITQRDLTGHLGIQPGSASEILAKLENADLIIRTPNEYDRRTIDISLTEHGRELAAEASAQRVKRHKEMFSCISEEEKQELLSILEKVCADWRTRYRENGKTHEHGNHHGHHDGHEHHDGHGHNDDHEHHGDQHRNGGN